MISKFLNLEGEKQERIINAAMQEFAEKGYKNASTNEIVKNANISKGLLFHYFKSKKGLFLFLFEYAEETFLNEFYSRMDYTETDMIKRWRQIGLLKLELIQKYPGLHEFLINSILEDDPVIKKEIGNKYDSKIQEATTKIFENINTGFFKEEMDIKRVTEIIMWVVQGYSNQLLNNIKRDPDWISKQDVNELIRDFDKYMELMKSVFYK